MVGVVVVGVTAGVVPVVTAGVVPVVVGVAAVAIRALHFAKKAFRRASRLKLGAVAPVTSLVGLGVGGVEEAEIDVAVGGEVDVDVAAWVTMTVEPQLVRVGPRTAEVEADVTEECGAHNGWQKNIDVGGIFNTEL